MQAPGHDENSPPRCHPRSATKASSTDVHKSNTGSPIARRTVECDARLGATPIFFSSSREGECSHRRFT